MTNDMERRVQALEQSVAELEQRAEEAAARARRAAIGRVVVLIVLAAAYALYIVRLGDMLR